MGRGVQTEGIISAKALRQEQAECVDDASVARTQSKRGSETGRRPPGPDHIGRALEAMAATEIYSRSVGKPPKGLGQGVT